MASVSWWTTTTPATAAMLATAPTYCRNTYLPWKYQLLYKHSQSIWSCFPKIVNRTAYIVLLTPGSTTTHSKVKVAHTFGREISSLWGYFTKLSTALPSGLIHGKNVDCCLCHGDKEYHLLSMHHTSTMAPMVESVFAQGPRSEV